MTPLGRLEDQRTRTRLVLAASIVGGLLTAVFYLLLRPSPNTPNVMLGDGRSRT